MRPTTRDATLQARSHAMPAGYDGPLASLLHRVRLLCVDLDRDLEAAEQACQLDLLVTAETEAMPERGAVDKRSGWSVRRMKTGRKDARPTYSVDASWSSK
jgi:hypothetical protein